MKKLYSLIALSAFGVAAFAQNRVAVPTNQNLNMQLSSPSIQTLASPSDTLWGNLFSWTGAQCNGSQGGGYVMGNNGYGDKQKAQAFVSTGPTNILGAIYWFGAKKVTNGGPNSVVKFRIYKMDGPGGTTSQGTAMSPNTVSVSNNVNITMVDTSSMLTNAYVHTFSPSFWTAADFAVGFDVTALTGDSIGGVYSADGDAGMIDQSWDQFSDNTWHTWADPNNWNMNCDMAIFPIVDIQSGINEPTFLNGVSLSTYPNPAVETATVSYSLQNNVSNVTIMIMDVKGKVISKLPQGSQSAGTHTLNLDAKQFAPGTYFVTISAGKGHIATKLVIE